MLFCLLLSKLGMVRQETWSYSTWFSKRTIFYAYRNFKGNNVKQYVMLKYNNAEPPQ